MLFRVVLAFQSVGGVVICAIQMKVIYIECMWVVYCGNVFLYNVVLSVEFVDEILNCQHSNETYCAALSFCAFYYAVPALHFVDEILKDDQSNESC